MASLRNMDEEEMLMDIINVGTQENVEQENVAQENVAQENVEHENTGQVYSSSVRVVLLLVVVSTY